MNLEFPTTAGALSRFLQAELIGDASAPVVGLAALEEATEGTLSYLADKKLSACLDNMRGTVLVTRRELVEDHRPLTYLVVPQPQLAFARVAREVTSSVNWRGIAKEASVDPTAILGEGVSVGPFAVVGPGAVVGAGTLIHPHACVGANVKIGEDCEIRSRVTLEPGVRLGARVKVFSGTVIGSDGFGLIPAADGSLSEMPQLGTVVVGDDVRIGANCTIDRATFGETVIGEGTKIDNQVHIAHNVKIGKHCILCGHVGISGSVTLGDRVVMAGQVGVADHCVIGDDAKFGGQTGVGTNLKGGETYFGSPAIPIREAHRLVRMMRRLPEIWDRLKKLEARSDDGQ